MSFLMQAGTFPFDMIPLCFSTLLIIFLVKATKHLDLSAFKTNKLRKEFQNQLGHC